MKFRIGIISFLSLIIVLSAMPTWAIGEDNDTDDLPNAEIQNDEGGTVVITGQVSYTNAFFASGVSEPVILLEDQTGFVNRDRSYVLPVESQQLGQITSDFFISPFAYTLSLPLAPQAPLNDVDNDDEVDTGVMIFQIAYWTNTFGDAFLEERDLFGGGWSGAYASAEVSSLVETRGEYTGGTIVIYAPESGQAFPSGFGDDEMLFTEDDPLVIVPQGWTVVNMDDEIFTFDRSREVEIDLIEGEGSEADDFSDMDYPDAFSAMVEKLENEYAFSEYYNIDWESLYQEYAPIIDTAFDNNDPDLFSLTLQDFLWQIPDGHVNMSLTIATFEEFAYNTDGGLGIAIRQLDDGSVIVTYLTEDSPASNAGIELQAEILEINGVPIAEAIQNTQPYSAPYSTEHVRNLQKMRYVTRYPLGTELKLPIEIQIAYGNKPQY